MTRMSKSIPGINFKHTQPFILISESIATLAIIFSRQLFYSFVMELVLVSPEFPWGSFSVSFKF